MSPKILILTTEPLPLPGLPATGAGLRAWGLGFGLRAAGFPDVELAFAADAVRGRETNLGAVPGVSTFERGKLDEFVKSKAPGVIVFQHWGILKELKQDPGCPIAIDLAGPHLLERQLWNSPNPASDLREKLTALSRADFVVCSGNFQRHYFLPFLVQAGFDPRGILCPVIPFSLSPDLPEPVAARDCQTFVFGGMFLPWQDPGLALRAVVEALEEQGRGQLLFIGGPHPAGDVSGGRFDKLIEYLQQSKHVEMHSVLPFDELLGKLRHCGAAIDLMPRNAERELAFPTRTVTYMWAGLPVIHNTYDELAEPIEQEKAGWTFDASDEKEVKKLVVRLLGHREDVKRRSKNAQALVRKHYTWDKTIKPLAEWCGDPKPRDDKRAVVVAGAEIAKPAPTVSPARRRRRDQIFYSPPAPATDTARGPWYLSPVVFLLALPVSAVLVFLFGLAEIARMVVRRR